MKQVYDLELELKKVIETVVKDYKSSTTDGDLKVPTVIVGPVPSENPEEILPAIGIIASSGKNSLDCKEINIETSIVLVIDDTEKTYQTLYEMIDKISTEIISKGIYLNEFEIYTGIEWKINSNSSFMSAEVLFKVIRRKIYRTDVDAWINGE